MRKIAAVLLVFILIPMVCACGGCDHKWVQATCANPQYCEKCGITNGAALGHDWIRSGENSMTCSRCGITQITGDSSTASYAPPSSSNTESSSPSSGSNSASVSHWYDSHIKKIQSLDSNVFIPDDVFFLDSPETKTVLGKKGRCIYERSNPNSDAKDLGKLENGTVVTVLARQNGYALFVTSGGHYAWGTDQLIVDGNDTPYLVNGKEGSGKKMTMSHDNKVNVRYDPYAIFPVMTTMAPDTKVTAYRTVNGYTYVEAGATKGWVHSKFLT